MDGLRTLKHIMKDNPLPVIMVSTEGSNERINEAMELGANGYVLKPFTPEALAAQLRPLGLMPDGATATQDDVDLDDPDAF